MAGMVHDSIGDSDSVGGGDVDGDGDATRGFCMIEKNPGKLHVRKHQLRMQCHSVT